MTGALPILGSEFTEIVERTWGIAIVRGLVWSVIVVLLIITPMALMSIWLERRLSGKMQARIGPNRVGWQGLLQTLADGVKLLGKENLVPTAADKPLFHLAPIIVFVAAFGMYAALPWGPDWTPTTLATGVVFVLAVGALEAIGVIMAGWASNNKWALLGTMRVAAQVVSYEVPLGLTALVPVLSAGTMNLQTITVMQQGALWNWGVFWAFPANLIALVIFFWSALANLKRAPFDLPEAESELVAGFHTEYSGMAFSIFFLAEYAAMFVLSCVASALWLGGWGVPWCPIEEWSRWEGKFLDLVPWNIVWNFIAFNVLAAKGMFLVAVMMWLRWTLPRLRVDQVMRLCWKFFLPLSLGALLWAALWVAADVPFMRGAR
ncbi:MAG TPA: NADH-quinone oxidoreductase subunit NuoH [Planctomycetota bacterium]|nr:NADH-quinone oxidoreductase subunit NuoH [Planctomycetota bacterium]